MAIPEVDELRLEVYALRDRVDALEAWKATHVVLNNAVCEQLYWASRKHWRPGTLLDLRKALELLCEGLQP